MLANQRFNRKLAYIQTAVDQDPTPGRFVLTGSQNFLLMSQVARTMAGRCGILNLLPFSRAELEDQPRRGRPAVVRGAKVLGPFLLRIQLLRE